MDNIVNLTAREHYVAHKILVKAYLQQYGRESEQYKKMISALFFMATTKRWTSKISSRMYDELKSEIAKIQHENNVGERNPMFGRDWREGKTKEELEQHNKRISDWYWMQSEEYRKNFKKIRSILYKGKNIGRNVLKDWTNEQLDELRLKK